MGRGDGPRSIKLASEPNSNKRKDRGRIVQIEIFSGLRNCFFPTQKQPPKFRSRFKNLHKNAINFLSSLFTHTTFLLFSLISQVVMLCYIVNCFLLWLFWSVWCLSCVDFLLVCGSVILSPKLTRSAVEHDVYLDLCSFSGFFTSIICEGWEKAKDFGKGFECFSSVILKVEKLS